MSAERDVMARFIDLADQAKPRLAEKVVRLCQLNSEQGIDYIWNLLQHDDRISHDVASAYADIRNLALVHPDWAWQAAMIEAETSERLLFQAIDFSGIHDPAKMPEAYRLQVAMFVRYCETCALARSYEIAMELERHPETGSETDGL